MVNAISEFSGVSVDDLNAAKEFYTKTLGLKIDNEEMGLHFSLPSGGSLFIYEKENHEPATYTYLNFAVKNIDETVDSLVEQGVVFEKYEGFDMDDKGIARGLSANQGPDIAWFTDPAKNIIAVLQDS